MRRTYRLGRTLGVGTFGSVKQAATVETGLGVAIKTIEGVDGAESEARVLAELRHPSIITLHGSFYGEDGFLRLILEIMPQSLDRLLHEVAKDRGLSGHDIIVYSSQMFAALAHCHSHNYVHCDIKPQNLLVGPSVVQLKIADLGSATKRGTVRDTYYCSRWYRPPEVIFSAQVAEPAQDVWSAGTVLAEMYTLQPIFQGGGSVEQMAAIIAILGTPSAGEMQALSGAPFRMTPEIPPFPWSVILGAHSNNPCATLLAKCLRYNPAERISAAEASRRSGECSKGQVGSVNVNRLQAADCVGQR